LNFVLHRVYAWPRKISAATWRKRCPSNQEAVEIHVFAD
jgi:hypothetical protein